MKSFRYLVYFMVDWSWRQAHIFAPWCLTGTWVDFLASIVAGSTGKRHVLMKPWTAMEADFAKEKPGWTETIETLNVRMSWIAITAGESALGISQLLEPALTCGVQTAGCSLQRMAGCSSAMPEVSAYPCTWLILQKGCSTHEDLPEGNMNQLLPIALKAKTIPNTSRPSRPSWDGVTHAWSCCTLRSRASDGLSQGMFNDLPECVSF